MNYAAIIKKIRPTGRDEGVGRIFEAQCLLSINEKKLWCFIPNWESSAEKWSMDLEGKTIKIRLVFLNLNSKKSKMKKIGFSQSKEYSKPCDYFVVGKIINKWSFPTLENKFEKLLVDCGNILVEMSSEKGKFEIGDYIEDDGRLDVYRVIVDE